MAADASGAVAADGTFRERTLATRYQQRQQLPENFPQVLKDLTREILRCQPTDMLAWCAEYFKALALQEESAAAGGMKQRQSDRAAPHAVGGSLPVSGVATSPGLASPPHQGSTAPLPEEPNDACDPSMPGDAQDAQTANLASQLMMVFEELDVDRSGHLYPQMIKTSLMESCRLTEGQALYILTNAYAILSEEGTIEYARFAQECVNALTYFQQMQQDFPIPQIRSDDDDSDAMVHGMSRRELEKAFLNIFAAGDDVGAGFMTFAEYHVALRNAQVQLTDRDIKLLCVEADRMSERGIDYRSEVRHFFQRLLLANQFTVFDENADVEEEEEEEQPAVAARVDPDGDADDRSSVARDEDGEMAEYEDDANDEAAFHDEQAEEPKIFDGVASSGPPTEYSEYPIDEGALMEDEGEMGEELVG